MVRGFLGRGGVSPRFGDPHAGTAGGEGTFTGGINNLGVIAGTYRDAGGVVHGFIDRGGVFPTINHPHAGTAPGQGAAGVHRWPRRGHRDLLQPSRQGRLLFRPPRPHHQVDDPAAPAYSTFAGAINNSGVMRTYGRSSAYCRGSSTVAGCSPRSTTRHAGTETGQGTAVEGISDPGVAAGFYTDSHGTNHGFAFTHPLNQSPAGRWPAQARPRAHRSPRVQARTGQRTRCTPRTAQQATRRQDHHSSGHERTAEARRPGTPNWPICTKHGAATRPRTDAPIRRSGATVRISTVTLRDHTGRLTGEVKHRCWGLGWPTLQGLSPTREVPMATSSTSTAVASVGPVFTEPERLALAGFLAGYTGLTREAYALDLRQYASWCQQNHLRLFGARRADIECFARDLEARGRSRATITRRLCTIAGFYKYAVEEELLEHSPAAHVRRPRLDYESHATALDRNELGALLVAAGLGEPAEHALISLLALNGLRVSEATGANIEALGVERGHRTLVIIRKGGKVVTIPLAPRTARAIDLAVGSAATGRSSWLLMAVGWIGTVRRGSSAGSPAARGSPSRWAAYAAPRVHHGGPGCWGTAARCAGSRLARRSPHHNEVRPGPRQPGPARDLHCRRLSRWCRPVRTAATPPGRTAAARRRRASRKLGRNFGCRTRA